MCLHVFWYQHFDFLFTYIPNIPYIPIHVLVEFNTCIDGQHTVWFPLCVTYFLLMLYFALCVMCILFYISRFATICVIAFGIPLVLMIY